LLLESTIKFYPRRHLAAKTAYAISGLQNPLYIGNGAR